MDYRRRNLYYPTLPLNCHPQLFTNNQVERPIGMFLKREESKCCIRENEKKPVLKLNYLVITKGYEMRRGGQKRNSKRSGTLFDVSMTFLTSGLNRI